MRSASGVVLIAVLTVGCSTTQQEAARLQLNSARIRASQAPVRLGPRDQQVAVTSTTLITARGRSAVVVTLRNNAAAPISDLPLLVRISRARYLNASSGLPYFQTHVPAIAAHGALRWVLTVSRPLSPGSAPFAEVGTPTGEQHVTIRALPAVRVAASRGLITVSNRSSVPQYQLPVYAIASRDGREVAAGQTTIAHLGNGDQVRLRVPLVGDPSGATLSLEAPPTIFN